MAAGVGKWISVAARQGDENGVGMVVLLNMYGLWYVRRTSALTVRPIIVGQLLTRLCNIREHFNLIFKILTHTVCLYYGQILASPFPKHNLESINISNTYFIIVGVME